MYCCPMMLWLFMLAFWFRFCCFGWVDNTSARYLTKSEMFNPLVDVHGVKFGAQVERVLVIREGYALILEAANGGR